MDILCLVRDRDVRKRLKSRGYAVQWVGEDAAAAQALILRVASPLYVVVGVDLMRHLFPGATAQDFEARRGAVQSLDFGEDTSKNFLFLPESLDGLDDALSAWQSTGEDRIVSAADFPAFVDELTQAYRQGEFVEIGFDTETTGLDISDPTVQVTTCSLYVPSRRLAAVSVCRHPELYMPESKWVHWQALMPLLDAGDIDPLAAWLEVYRAFEGRPWRWVTSEDEDAALAGVAQWIKLSKRKRRPQEELVALRERLTDHLRVFEDRATRGVDPGQQRAWLLALDRLLSTVPIVGHNLKFDLSVLLKEGVGRYARVADDSYFSATLLYGSERTNLDLESLSLRFLPVTAWKDQFKADPRLKKPLYGKRYDRVSLAKHAQYALDDARNAYLLNQLLREKLDAHTLDTRGLRETVRSVLPAFASAEVHRVSLDLGLLDALRTQLETEVNAALDQLQAFSRVQAVMQEQGLTTLNPNVSGARNQLVHVLFTPSGYGLRSVRATETGNPSVDKEVVDTLIAELERALSALEVGDDPVVYVQNHITLRDDNRAIYQEALAFLRCLKGYRDVHRIYSSYIKPILISPYPLDAFPAEFNVIGATVTGRLSSGFHLIPKKSDVKKFFVSAWGTSSRRTYDGVPGPGQVYQPYPPPRSGGGLLLMGDYSQLELYIIALLADEDSLIQAFAQGEDIHAYIAAQVFPHLKHVPLADIKTLHTEERSASKAISFGLIFGKQAETEAMVQLYAQFFARFPAIARFIDAQHALVRKEGKVTTPFGRVRFLPAGQYAPTERNRHKILEAERQGVNTPVQSTASDCALYACAQLFRGLHALRLRSRFLGSIHDAILTDCYPGELSALLPLLHRSATEMEFSFLKGNRLNFELSVGASWGRQMTVEQWEIREDRLFLKLEGGNRDFIHLKKELARGYPGVQYDQVETLAALTPKRGAVEPSTAWIRAALTVPVYDAGRANCGYRGSGENIAGHG